MFIQLDHRVGIYIYETKKYEYEGFCIKFVFIIIIITGFDNKKSSLRVEKKKSTKMEKKIIINEQITWRKNYEYYNKHRRIKKISKKLCT